MGDHRYVEMREYTSRGLTLRIPTYMWNVREEIIDYVYRKLLERLEQRGK